MASAPSNQSGAQTAALSPRWKVVISAVLVLHLAAVIVSPLSIEGSPIAGRLWLWFRPYVQAAYLNHGYHFFAPQPGPSHLLRYELALSDGRRVEGTIPNLRENRPRLFYHRHFMLTEFLNVLHGQAEGIEDATAPPRVTLDKYSRSYANHLLKKHDARQVTIRLVRHMIPFPNEVAAGRPLDDPALYEKLYERAYVASVP